MNRRRGSRRPGEDVEELRSTTPAEEDLSPEEAARRLELCGPNEVQVEPRTPVWRRGLQQLRDPLILVLLVAAALTIATGDLSDAAVILLVITVNTVVGVVQEVRAEAAVMALSAMSAPAARVVRDGANVPYRLPRWCPATWSWWPRGTSFPRTETCWPRRCCWRTSPR
ncbi:cation-transporting P-type ATPase [Streptomyces milbemycinicus]|uniref:Cation-transporting P-type ATPase n=1 Tax=Streptomyces milbemycinicus TaxID=476552 RepID=A0ABW8LK61_9ACTN